MTTLAQDFKGVVQQGFAWWTGELSALVPSSFGRGRVAAPPGLVVSLRDGDLWLTDDSPPSKTGGTETSEPLTGSALMDRLERRRRVGSSRPSVRLRLPYSACLVRRVDVPERARADAERILALDFERATPFSAGDVYIAYTPDPAGNRPGTVTFLQLIAKKAMVDDALARLENLGAPADAVDCWQADGKTALPVNFLAHAATGGARQGSKTNRATKVLTGLAAALAVSAVWMSLVRHQNALSELEQQTADARARVTEIETASGAGAAAINDRVSVVNLKAERPATVHVLDELTRLMPDTAFLTEFSIAGDTVDISGFAPRAAALVPQLERSQEFSNVTLSAPVTFDDARNKERFSYRLQLRHSMRAGDASGSPSADQAEPVEALP